jgi:poly(hydroxyalkanoate) depolymerase family esterase
MSLFKKDTNYVSISKINLDEVTRLTRAGKLGEAMALLRAPATAKINAPGAAGNPKPVMDMTAQAFSGNSWKNRMQNLPGAYRFGPHSLPEGGSGLRGARAPGVPIPHGARFAERRFSNQAGSRTYKVYVPSGYTGQPLPLVVMLHGCTQDPDDFAAGTRMNDMAEEKTFLVAYPGQPQAANMQKCWNWFNAKDQQREGGEPSLIAGIARQVIEEFSADASRIYVAGLSAGGAAAAVLAGTYPDLFAAVGIHSGLGCGAALDMPSAFAAMGGHGLPLRHREGAPMPTIVFHGDADRTVNAANADQLVGQMTAEAVLTKIVTRGQTDGGAQYTRTVHCDANGDEIIELWILHGAGHAWSGGSTRGSYTDPRGPDASREMTRFFLAHSNENRSCSL